METFIRKDLSGIIIGGLELEPKDIETIDDVADYFKSRGIQKKFLISSRIFDRLDITQNEVLLFRFDFASLC